VWAWDYEIKSHCFLFKNNLYGFIFKKKVTVVDGGKKSWGAKTEQKKRYTLQDERLEPTAITHLERKMI